jgi:integrase
VARKSSNAGRNRNGVGTIRKLRENLYQGSIQLEPGDRRYVSGHTLEEAEKKLVQLRMLYQQGRLPAKSKLTVRDYFKQWLRDHVDGKKAPRTCENYALNVERLDPHIGGVHLDALKPAHITAAYRALEERGLAPRSIQQAHRVLRAAMRQAVRSELLYRDPTFGVTPPRAPHREERVFTRDEVQRLFQATKGTRWYPLWVLLATTGMRLGEALGLQWRDLDLESDSVIIRRDVERLKGKGMVYGDVKTPASRRQLWLVPGAVTALRALRAQTKESCLLIGMPWDDRMPVLATPDGKLVELGSVNKAFRSALQRAGLTPARPHDLRHTVSSYIQSQGRSEREAQEVLGHESELTTKRIYTHVMPDRRRDIMKPLQDFFPDEGTA